MATASWDGTVRVWDATTGDPVGQPLTGHTGSVRGWRCSRPGGAGPDGLRQPRQDGAGVGPDHWAAGRAALDRPHRLGVGGGGGHRRGGGSGWPPPAATGRCGCGTRPPGHAVGQPLTGHTGSVTGVAAFTDPGGRVRLATASWDQTVRVWDPTTGPRRAALTGHTSAVAGVAVVTDGGDGSGWPPPAATGRCGCGTRHGRHRRPPSKATPTRWRVWRCDDRGGGTGWPPPATTGRCGCGTRPPGPPSGSP